MSNQILESLGIKNFRSYKDIFVEFHPGVNCITGANDSGKTNLLRAINLLAQNQPDGDDYISDWGGDMDIQLKTGGKTVGRFRNAVWNKKEEKYKAGTENLYTLSGEREPFKSFGRKKLPDIIKQHLSISPINIAYQLDGPFLLGKSPPEVAKHYNELVNLTVIDTTLRNIAKTLKNEKAGLKVQQELEAKKTEELTEFDWLPGAEKELSELERLNGYLKKLNSDWSDLCGLIENLKKLETQNQELSEITKHGTTVDILGTKSIEIAVQKQRQNELSNLITNFEFLTNEDKELKEIIRYQDEADSLIKKSNQIDVLVRNEIELDNYIQVLKHNLNAEKRYKSIVKYADTTEALLVLDRVIEKSISEYNLLQDLCEKRVKLSKIYDEWDSKQQALEKAFKNLMPDECPLCGK